jgi:hypothetical protein
MDPSSLGTIVSIRFREPFLCLGYASGSVYTVDSSGMLGKRLAYSPAGSSLLDFVFSADGQQMAMSSLSNTDSSVSVSVNGKVIYQLLGRQGGATNPGGKMAYDLHGNLFVAFGDDGQGQQRIQDTDTDIGKVVRLDASGSAQTFSVGFRNPTSVACTSEGHMIVTDDFYDDLQKVEAITKGSNHGWGIRKGAIITAPIPRHTAPRLFPFPLYQQQTKTYKIAGASDSGNVFHVAFGGSILPLLKKGKWWKVDADTKPKFLEGSTIVGMCGGTKGVVYALTSDSKVFKL